MAERDDRAGWQASLPPRWLNDSTYKGLSVKAWALFTWTLAWAVDQENDGEVRDRDLPFIASPMLNTTESVAAAVELVAAGLWETTGDGYQVARWGQSQPTSAEMEARRATWRRQKQGKPKSTPPRTPHEKSSDSTVEPGRIPEGNEGIHVRTNATYETNAMDEREGRDQGPRFEEATTETEVDTSTGEVLDVPRFESYIDELGRRRKRKVSA